MDFDGSANVLELERQVEALRADGADLGRRVAQLEAERAELRRALAVVLGASARQGLLDDEEEAFLVKVLGRRQQDDPANEVAAKAAHIVIGKIRCQCGAAVDDIKGVTTEVCPWCGAQLGSAR
jgi:septal ring factor EnvC (AmiA/AmiB activator)